ncbi:hypothetical protein, partial [Mesorhizobium sp. M8A.F.Ca.ET.142.01.1.1]|uniref:hypothetical protein n=1 Tax=Mesorhizobium sp. M8A.F.Ca.ET.142.01.1.1 TaxID=2563958 RepID=UPI001AEDF0CE
GGWKRIWLRVATFEKATALRSAPSKDRQIGAGLYSNFQRRQGPAGVTNAAGLQRGSFLRAGQAGLS